MAKKASWTGRIGIAVIVVAVLVGGGALWLRNNGGETATEPTTTGGPTVVRRLSQAEYTRSIDQIFGDGIEIPGRFEPPLRDEGLLAIGSGKVSVTPSGLEQYELRAREISASALAEDRRASIMPCTPQSADAFDEACAKQFFAKYGRLLFRRPLGDTDMNDTLKLAQAGTEQTGDFYKGLQAGLSRLLVSPNFIFRVERSEPDPESGGALRLDAYSLATRISFLLWDAPPDEELLDAAASGGLRDPQKLSQQVDRMIASPQFEQGVRAFFSDMFGYEEFDGLSKDQTIFPKFTSALSADAKEQSLRTIVDLLVTNKGDYRKLFTTKKTFLNRRLGSLYKVPVDQAAFDGWMPYTFKPEDNRAGLLTFAAFLMLDPTHEGGTSPTIRGKHLREFVLCQKIPDPPANVDFSKFTNPDPALKTKREILAVHRSEPTCAGCHALTDPVGLSMENYNGIGDFRTREKGAVIDASGTLDGKSYNNLVELGQVLHNDPSVSSCVAQRVFEYGTGRTIAENEQDWFDYLNQKFADEGYVFVDLMKTVATSKAFQAVSTSTTVAAN